MSPLFFTFCLFCVRNITGLILKSAPVTTTGCTFFDVIANLLKRIRSTSPHTPLDLALHSKRRSVWKLCFNRTNHLTRILASSDDNDFCFCNESFSKRYIRSSSRHAQCKKVIIVLFECTCLVRHIGRHQSSCWHEITSLSSGPNEVFMTNIGRKVQATNKFIMMMFPFSTFYSICKIIDENSVMNYNNNKNASVCLLFITERIFENRICPKLGFTR